jgi:hypothetical protein
MRPAFRGGFLVRHRAACDADPPIWGAVKKWAPGRLAENATDQRIVNQIGNHLLLRHMRDGGGAEAFRYPNHGVHRLKGTSSSV